MCLDKRVRCWVRRLVDHAVSRGEVVMLGEVAMLRAMSEVHPATPARLTSTSVTSFLAGGPDRTAVTKVESW